MSVAGRLVLMVLPAGLLVLAVWNHPDFVISSDTLLPAALTWDLLHHHGAWGSFQQARVPSFFPDLAAYGLFQALTGSWRAATGLWILSMVGWLIGIAAWLSSRLANAPLWPAAVACLLIIVPLLALGAAEVEPSMNLQQLGHLPLFPYLIVLLPFTHGGPFLLALTAAALASGPAQDRAPVKILLLGVFSVMLSLSDLLVVASLLLPLTMALFCGLSVGSVTRRHLTGLVGAAWIGAGLGWACAQTLDRQAIPYPPIASIPHYALRWLNDLERQPVMILAVAALILAVAADIRQRGWRGWLGNFWSVFAATSAFGALLITALLYENMWSYRYALPFLWWPIILATAGLTKVIARYAWFRLTALPACSAIGLFCAVPSLEEPALFRWQSPLARCLTHAGVHAGLAEYWSARVVTASTNWAIQVNQITSAGTAYIWGNDRSWFDHDIHDVSLRPSYDFIVMDHLDPSQIVAIYGEPSGRLACGASMVWLYDDAMEVNAALLAASAPHAPNSSVLGLN
jgi:hypothetical protein